VYDKEAVIEDYGVNQGSYEVKTLPKIRAYQVRIGGDTSASLVR